MMEKASYELKSHYVRVNNVKLHYKTEGKGPLLIMLHGFPEFWYSWRYQIPALSKHFKVITPDMRGFNLSEKPSKVKDFRIPALIEDVKQLIHALGEKDAYIVGHDWGGIVSWAFASEHPEMVMKMAILNMPHVYELVRAYTRFNLEQIRKSYYVFLFQIPYFPEKYITSASFFSRLMHVANRGDKINIPENEKIYTEAYSHKGTATATINYYRAAIQDYLTGNLYKFKPIKPSLLMLWGSKDHALGKELTLNTHKYCEGEFKILYNDNSGHNPHQDDPQWVNENLLKHFLE